MSVRADDNFDTKLESHAYAKAYAKASHRHRKVLAAHMADLSEQLDRAEAENALLRSLLQNSQAK